MGRKHKLEKGRTYDTHDGKKLHIIAVKPNGFNGDPIWSVKINGKYLGGISSFMVYKHINGR